MKTTSHSDSDIARAYSVALTGGIASGKSTVAEAFHRRGVPVFDADVIARDLVQPGKPALAEIAAAFGDAMLTSTGELDRRRMRERVFGDVNERRRLEGILHPRVREVLLAAAAACKDPYCVLVIPLLSELHDDYAWVDRALVVDVPFETQIVRVMRRDAITRDAALRILSVQATREQRLALADDVIDNAGPAGALDAAVARLHARYLGLAARKMQKQI
ncbi:MAG TPA: dephospho-CoA kinase [Rudaea sp.]|nr:dephospho-CoA kinase [Rudaea sp.]